MNEKEFIHLAVILYIFLTYDFLHHSLRMLQWKELKMLFHCHLYHGLELYMIKSADQIV